MDDDDDDDRTRRPLNMDHPVYDLLGDDSDLESPFMNDAAFDERLDINDIIGTSPLVRKPKIEDTSTTTTTTVSGHRNSVTMMMQPAGDISNGGDPVHPMHRKIKPDPTDDRTSNEGSTQGPTEDSESNDEDWSPNVISNTICKRELDITEFASIENELYPAKSSTPPSAVVRKVARVAQSPMKTDSSRLPTPPPDEPPSTIEPSSSSSSQSTKSTTLQYIRSPDLQHIMSDHNYHTAEHRDDAPIRFDPNDCTMDDLLNGVLDKLNEGSPVYDLRLELLSLVVLLVNDKISMNSDVIQSIDEKVKLIKLSANALDGSQESAEQLAKSSILIDAEAQTEDQPTCVSVATHTEPEDDPSCQPEPAEAALVLDKEAHDCLQRIRQFGVEMSSRNEQLIDDVRQNDAANDRTSVLSAYVASMESGFRELMKEFKTTTKLSEKPEKTPEEKAEAARRLNETSKQRWLAASSSEDEETNAANRNGNQSDCSSVESRKSRKRKRPSVSAESVMDPIKEQERMATTGDNVDCVEHVAQKIEPTTVSGVDDGRRTMSCEWMEKLIYETDSDQSMNADNNNMYDSLDEPTNYQPLDPLNEEHYDDQPGDPAVVVETESAAESQSYGQEPDATFKPESAAIAANSPVTRIPTETSGMSDEEFLGFTNGQDVANDAPQQPTDIHSTYHDEDATQSGERVKSTEAPIAQHATTNTEIETLLSDFFLDGADSLLGDGQPLAGGDSGPREVSANDVIGVLGGADEEVEKLATEETTQIATSLVTESKEAVDLDGKTPASASNGPSLQLNASAATNDYIEDEDSSQDIDFMMPVEVQMDEGDDDDADLNGTTGFGDADDSGAAEYNGANEAEADASDLDSVEADDRDIDRLLDFTSLNVRRRPDDGTYYVPLKKPDSAKPAKVVSESLLNDVGKVTMDMSGSSGHDLLDSTSEAEEDVLTEQQYLQQCNLSTKEKLLKMVSSESEDELPSEDVSGAGSEANDDEEEDNSKDSAIDRFLKHKIIDEEIESIKKETTALNGNATANDDGANTSAKSGGGTATKKPAKVNGIHDPATDDLAKKESLADANTSKVSSKVDSNDDESDDTPDDEPPPKTAKLSKEDKHIMGKGIFSGLDDFIENEPAEPVLDINEIDAVSDRSTLSSDCELLDTTMYKASKDKDLDDKQLSRLMKNASRKSAAAKTTVAQAAAAADDCISLSSDTDLDLDEEVVEVPDDVAEVEKDSSSSQGEKRAPRRMLRADQLADATKSAQTEEKERVKRLEAKCERLAKLAAEAESSKKKDGAAEQPSDKPTLEESDVVLDYDSKTKSRITVHPDIVKHLKPHQVDGVKFMYDSCYGSIDDKHPGSGCILAHCMGLGKTLQLIALLHTLMRHVQLKTNKILVICPKSTLMNWAEEIERWLGPVRGGPSVKVYQFPDSSDINEKLSILKAWQNSGKPGYSKAGCLLIGYEAFRTLVFFHLTKKRKRVMAADQLDAIKRKVEETLLKPGADIVICDEGHMIKNRKSATSLAVNEIKTRKRIILTGTPIQNNLKEYYSMVNFIKPSFLGTEKEFANLYANPIRVGQHKDSSKGEIKFMKQRSYVLHKKLSKFVQRREAALLKTFLPEKYEYVLFIPMTDVQNRLYVHFLENNPLKEKYGGKSLIPDYTFLRKIWTHPKVLESAYNNALLQLKKKESRMPKRTIESEDEQPDDVLDNQQGSMSVTSDWWRRFVTPEDLESLLPSNKLRTLFEILQMCQENGEKCLVFSAFVAVLDVVEFFMKQINDQKEGQRVPGLERYRGPWIMTKDYYRLDGKTPKSIRHAMITRFNSVANTRTRCFLISAKAGGQGINLIGANRVILLDTSWNPSNDQQNIFRVFRLGQKHKCYIYRLLAMGTMEEKVYSRSVTKQAMSFRVVDEQQIDRHYSMAELAELYTLTIPDYTTRPTPVRPYDNVLASLLHNFSDLVYKYHEHDSLLERNSEQDLSEEEKADAWAAYEKDVSLKNQYGQLPLLPQDGLFNAHNPYGALNLPYSQMGAYSGFGYPNAAAGMMNNYLGAMNPYGSPNVMEKELMMLSQMYNSPYANMLASTARGTSSQYPYGMPQSLPQSPYAAGMPGMPISTNAMSSYTSTAASGVGAGSMFSAQQQNLMASLSSYMPQYPKSSGSMGGLPPPPSMPRSGPLGPPSMRDIEKDVWSYLTNPSTRYGGDEHLIGRSSGGSLMPSNPSAPMSLGTAPGPNAMKNPLLFKELSIPCADPVPTPSNHPLPPASNHPLPSIPTSVITSVGPASSSSSSSPKDQQGPPSLRTAASHVANQQPTNRVPSPLIKDMAPPKPSPTTVTPLALDQHHSMATNKLPSTTFAAATITPSPQLNTNANSAATNKDVQRTMSTATPTRRSPLPMAKNSSTLLPTTSNTSSGPPEPHLTVKNVSAINQSIKQTAPPPNHKSSTGSGGSKMMASATLINKNSSNMGIVYPNASKTPSSSSSSSSASASLTHKFDLNQNNTILRTAQSQLNQLTKTNAALAALQASKRSSTVSSAPISPSGIIAGNNVVSKAGGRLPTTGSTAVDKLRSAAADALSPAGGSRVVRRINNSPTTAGGASTITTVNLTARNADAAADNIIVSSNPPATTKRWTNQSGLTISPIPSSSTIPGASKVAPTSLPKTKISGAATPIALPTAKPNFYSSSAQNLFKNKTNITPTTIIHNNKSTIRPSLGGSTNIINLPSSSAAATTTSQPPSMVRQNTAPVITGQTSGTTTTTTTPPTRHGSTTIQSTNNGTTIIRQQQQQRPLPPLVRQNTTPSMAGTTIKSIPNTTGTSMPTSNVQAQQRSAPIMNRNVTVRRIITPATRTNAASPSGVTAIRSTVGGQTAASSSVQHRTTIGQPSFTLAKGGAPVKGAAAGDRRPVTFQMKQLTAGGTPSNRLPPLPNGGGGADGMRRVVASSSIGAPSTNRIMQVAMPKANASAQQSSSASSPSSTAISGQKGVSPAAALQQMRKRKAVDLLPSVSITEIKKARNMTASSPASNLTTTTTASNKVTTAASGVQSGRMPSTMVKASNNPTLEEITILPRTTGTTTATSSSATAKKVQQRSKVGKPNSNMDIVQLD